MVFPSPIPIVKQRGVFALSKYSNRLGAVGLRFAHGRDADPSILRRE